MPHLHIHEGSDHDRGKTIRLPDEGVFLAGRDPTNDIPLLDGRASRHHLRIEVRPDGVWAVDLNSKNGSFVNNSPITEHRLEPGDQLRIGDSVLVFMTEPPPLTTSSRRPGESVARRLQTFYRARTEKNIPTVDEASARARRLIAFEVEGTLLTTDGMSTEILEQTLREVCNIIKPFEGFPINGRSETEIIRNVMRAAGMPPERIKVERPRVVTRYVTMLGSRLKKRARGNILPGIRNLLERLRTNPRWSIGLLTRKTLMATRLLLGHHGLLDSFPFGAFADDREQRDALPRVLLERARETTGVAFEPKDVYVVGDTVRDIAVGREAGMKTVAVATGGDTYEALAELKPDLLFHTLEDVDGVLAKLNAGMPVA
jgi:phosphoglycolate phosphatase